MAAVVTCRVGSLGSSEWVHRWLCGHIPAGKTSGLGHAGAAEVTLFGCRVAVGVGVASPGVEVGYCNVNVAPPWGRRWLG